MSITTQDFWQFSYSVYQVEEVQNTLLHAQDTLALNVNLALFCLFLNKHGLYLTVEQISQLNQSLITFNSEFTQQVRILRRAFKEKQEQIDQYEDVKKALLKAELLLEQQEQNILIQSYHSFLPTDDSDGDNLALYQGLLFANQPHSNQSALKLSDLNQYIH